MTCPASRCSWVNERFLSFGELFCCRHRLAGTDVKERVESLTEVRESAHGPLLSGREGLQSKHKILAEALPIALLLLGTYLCFLLYVRKTGSPVRVDGNDNGVSTAMSLGWSSVMHHALPQCNKGVPASNSV